MSTRVKCRCCTNSNPVVQKHHAGIEASPGFLNFVHVKEDGVAEMADAGERAQEKLGTRYVSSNLTVVLTLEFRG